MTFSPELSDNECLTRCAPVIRDQSASNNAAHVVNVLSLKTIFSPQNILAPPHPFFGPPLPYPAGPTGSKSISFTTLRIHLPTNLLEPRLLVLFQRARPRLTGLQAQ